MLETSTRKYVLVGGPCDGQTGTAYSGASAIVVPMCRDIVAVDKNEAEAEMWSDLMRVLAGEDVSMEPLTVEHKYQRVDGDIEPMQFVYCEGPKP